MSKMNLKLVVKAPAYAKWEGERFIIARYYEWKGTAGTYFMAYDKHNLSNRVFQEPVGTFDEAVTACEEVEAQQ